MLIYNCFHHSDTYRRNGGKWDDGIPATEPPLRVHSNGQATRKPTLRDLVRWQGFNWYDVGLQLELEDDDLETIAKNHPQDDATCRREMYKLWLKRKPDASYQDLVDALTKVGVHTVASSICAKYGKCTFSILPFTACIKSQSQVSHGHRERMLVTLVHVLLEVPSVVMWLIITLASVCHAYCGIR